MRHKKFFSVCVVTTWTLSGALQAWAQAPLPTQPAEQTQASSSGTQPRYEASELDRAVSPIALYPDPLLAQVLVAATFPDQVPDAARWADEHHNLTDSALASAIADDRLPWEPGVQALLPFPSVLEMMASDMPWTEEIGNAFLAQHADLMDAVQRMRVKARQFGYLRSNDRIIVSGGPFVEILPVDPAYVVVPYYDPAVVFLAPRPGFVLGTGIRFGFGVRVGAPFGPWGWGATRFAWTDHSLILNNARWGRTWANRTTYVHPYSVPRYSGTRPPERHAVAPRTPRERDDQRHGRLANEHHRN